MQLILKREHLLAALRVLLLELGRSDRLAVNPDRSPVGPIGFGIVQRRVDLAHAGLFLCDAALVVEAALDVRLEVRYWLNSVRSLRKCLRTFSRNAPASGSGACAG